MSIDALVGGRQRLDGLCGSARIGAALICLLLAPVATAAPLIPMAQLRAADWSGGLLDNGAFTPSGRARAAHEAFVGTLEFHESGMHSVPERISEHPILGRDTQLFPSFELAFLSVGADLVPVTQDVIRAGSVGRGHSYWDVIVQPGRIWSEPEDGGWSRGAFPFALVNSLEGETHNGLALFLYRGGRVSHVRFQIVQQTAPFYITTPFVASGTVSASLRTGRPPGLQAAARTFERSLRTAVQFASWEDLAAQVGAERLLGFDPGSESGTTVAAGLDFKDTFYLHSCASAAGPLPWCERARFGVWSATKVLANAVALLRLAEKYGPAVLDSLLQDYVPELRAFPGWSTVRFRDAIDMATGHGNGSSRREPNDIDDGYLQGEYSTWYEARSRDEKIAALLKTGGTYPWGAAEVARYRDQDMFLLGVAMDAFLKRKEGPQAGIWSMLEREVYAPIGIYYAPTNRTLEPDGPGQPLMAYGYYPTLGDMLKIARLLQQGGRAGDRQLLHAATLRELLPGPRMRGRPTGRHTPGGETQYGFAFWIVQYRALEGCRLYLPMMEGWGGNLVALLPRGITAVRVARAGADDWAADDPTSMAEVADRLVPFCP